MLHRFWQKFQPIAIGEAHVQQHMVGLMQQRAGLLQASGFQHLGLWEAVQQQVPQASAEQNVNDQQQRAVTQPGNNAGTKQ